MASFTSFLNLLKKNPATDGKDTFNIETMLNENWDKIDLKVEENSSAIGQTASDLNAHKAENATSKTVHGLRIEKGTWTPTAEGSTVVGANTYSVRNGQYTVIDDLVHCSFRILISSKDNAMAGNISIAGLPFSRNNSIAVVDALQIARYNKISLGSTGKSLNGILFNNSNKIQLFVATDVQFRNLISGDFIDAEIELMGSITYRK